MKLLTWNVNGLRAIIKKNIIVNNKNGKDNTFTNYINKCGADIICLIETKITNEFHVKITNMKYQFHSYVQSGRSGTSIYSKIKPIREIRLFDDKEGRIVCLEFEKFYLVGAYVPNSGSKLKRLKYRQEWDLLFYNAIKKLSRVKNIIIMGDMNVANDDIDIFNSATHKNHAGFTKEERNNMKKLLNLGLVDTYRVMHPNKQEFSYYDYRTSARTRNAGWRLDYILVSNELKSMIKSSDIFQNIYGSDHVPVVTTLANF